MTLDMKGPKETSVAGVLFEVILQLLLSVRLDRVKDFP